MDFDQIVQEYHRASQDFVKGNAKPTEDLFSKREDVSFAGTFGGIVRGWEAVEKALERSARTLYGTGEGTHGYKTTAKYLSAELGCIVEIERFRANIGVETEKSEGSLRVTSIFRKEDGVWKCVHRHADSLTSDQTTESVVQKHKNEMQPYARW